MPRSVRRRPATGWYSLPARTRARVVTPAGTVDSPITLTAQDTERRATLTSTDTAANLLDLDGGHIVIEGLDFGPTEVNVEAIRMHAGEQITVRDCSFSFIGGQSIVASTAGAAYSGLTIEDNSFESITGSAVTIGCYAGSADCTAADLTVQRNRVLGVTGGDGIVFEADAIGTIARNTVSGTSGPAVRVGGDVSSEGGVEEPLEGGLPSTMVEQNHLVGSGSGFALVVDGGPVVVRNNVVVSGLAGDCRSPTHCQWPDEPHPRDWQFHHRSERTGGHPHRLGRRGHARVCQQRGLGPAQSRRRCAGSDR